MIWSDYLDYKYQTFPDWFRQYGLNQCSLRWNSLRHWTMFFRSNYINKCIIYCLASLANTLAGWYCNHAFLWIIKRKNRIITLSITLISHILSCIHIYKPYVYIIYLILPVEVTIVSIVTKLHCGLNSIANVCHTIYGLLNI